MLLLAKLAAALAITVISEGLMAWLILKEKRCLWPSFLCNLLTNPLLNALTWLIYYLCGRTGYVAALIAMELAVVPAEGLVLKVLLPVPMKKALLVSLACNAFSFSIGLILNLLHLF